MQPPPPASWAPPVQTGPALGVSYGGAAARLIAYIVDGFILGLVFFVFWMLAIAVLAAAASSNSSAVAVLAGVVLLVMVVVGLAWKPYWWTHGGQTPGYRILRLRLVRMADGGPVTTGQAIGRLLSYVISSFLYLGFIWILIDSRRQGWHDKLAGTVVIEA